MSLEEQRKTLIIIVKELKKNLRLKYPDIKVSITINKKYFDRLNIRMFDIDSLKADKLWEQCKLIASSRCKNINIIADIEVITTRFYIDMMLVRNNP